MIIECMRARLPGFERDQEGRMSSMGTITAMKLTNIHHTAIAVHDLDEVIAEYRRLYGVEPIMREKVEAQGVEEAMIPIGGSFIQLLQPLGPDTPVGKFISANGEGLHHVCFAVADIELALEHLKAEGARLVDESPRVGGGNSKIAFVHPKQTAGTLIELIELP
jgi:methylmalonyl-CoA/ethylmalonyl-CoA epimerase